MAAEEELGEEVLEEALDFTTELRPRARPTWYRRRRRIIRRRAIRESIRRGVAPTPKNLITRDFMPKTDFDSTDAPWPAEKWEVTRTASANSWATLVKRKVDDKEMYTFTGVAIHDIEDQKITLIRFKLGEAEVKAIYSLTKAYVQEEPILEFSTPIKYNPGDEMIIEVYTTVDNPTIRLELLGFKTEPRGRTIAGKPSK